VDGSGNPWFDRKKKGRKRKENNRIILNIEIKREKRKTRGFPSTIPAFSPEETGRKGGKTVTITRLRNKEEREGGERREADFSSPINLRGRTRGTPCRSL